MDPNILNHKRIWPRTEYIFMIFVLENARYSSSDVQVT